MINFIAEVSSNHNGDLQRALQLIYAAKCIGASAVKFQLFKIDQLFAPEALRAKPYLNARRAWELPASYIPTLANYAHELGLQFACTPFYMAAIAELYPYVDFYKVASYQVLWLDFLRALHETGKPIVMSLGMANQQEADSAKPHYCVARQVIRRRFRIVTWRAWMIYSCAIWIVMWVGRIIRLDQKCCIAPH